MRTTVLTLLLACMALPLSAQDLGGSMRQFDDGNRLYQDGDFDGAVAAYRAAVDAGYVSGALYFNLGNAYFRLDRIGQAIRHYEKARVWMPHNTALAHNLTLAREQTVDTFSSLPEPFWRPAWRTLVRLVSPEGLFLVGVLFYVASAGVLALRIRQGPSHWLRRSALAGGALALSFLVFGFAASYERQLDMRAVILEDQITLLDRPEGAPTDVRVHEGTIIDVVTTRAAWSEIRLPNGVRGWMQSAAYGTI